MGRGPLVSVVVPVYNGIEHIGSTIDSVVRQTFPDFELVVVDNCSTDGTPSAVRAFDDSRIRLVVNDSNVGAVRNWNRALDEARGRYVKLLCADDLLYPTCLQRQVEVLQAHEADGVVMVAARRDIIGPNGRVLVGGRGLAGLRGVVPGDHAVRCAARRGTNIFGEPATVLVTAAAFDEAGPFSGRLPYMIDLEMWTRVLLRGGLFALPEPMAAFRVALGSWSRQLARQQSAQAVALLAELHESRPDVVRRSDLVVGSMRARLLQAGRVAAYRLSSSRGRIARPGADPAGRSTVRP